MAGSISTWLLCSCMVSMYTGALETATSLPMFVYGMHVYTCAMW